MNSNSKSFNHFWTKNQAHNLHMATCCVCFDGFSDDISKCLVCCECKLRIHHECFGELKNSFHETNNIFLCDRCQFMRRNDLKISDIQCVFCPNLFGLMRRFHYQGVSTKVLWCHVLCANMLREVYIEDNPSKIKDPTSLQLVIWSPPEEFKGRSKTMCSICKSKKGFALDCEWMNNSCKSLKCFSFFHATCGLKQRLVYYHKSIVALFPSKTNVYNLFCKFHIIQKLFHNKRKSKRFEPEIKRNVSKMLEYFKEQENKFLRQSSSQSDMKTDINNITTRQSNIRTRDQSSSSNKSQEKDVISSRESRYIRRNRGIEDASFESVNRKRISSAVQKVPRMSRVEQRNSSMNDSSEKNNSREEEQQNVYSNGNVGIIPMYLNNSDSLNQSMMSKSSKSKGKNEGTQEVLRPILEEESKEPEKYSGIPVQDPKSNNATCFPSSSQSKDQSLQNGEISNNEEPRHSTIIQTCEDIGDEVEHQKLIKLNDSFSYPFQMNNQIPILPQTNQHQQIIQKPAFKMEMNMMYFLNEAPKHFIFGKEHPIQRMSRIPKSIPLLPIILPNSLGFYLENWFDSK